MRNSLRAACRGLQRASSRQQSARLVGGITFRGTNISYPSINKSTVGPFSWPPSPAARLLSTQSQADGATTSSSGVTDGSDDDVAANDDDASTGIKKGIKRLHQISNEQAEILEKLEDTALKADIDLGPLWALHDEQENILAGDDEEPDDKGLWARLKGSLGGNGKSSREEELEQDIEDWKKAAATYKADAINIRNRGEQEKTRARKYASKNFAKGLLSVSDTLESALSTFPESEQASDIFQGIAATERNLKKVFKENGIEKIQPKLGEKLDPNFHEAMFEMPTDEYEPGTIAQVISPGFKLHDRLLRAAQTGVAKAAS